MSAPPFDAVIVGAGPNGLTAAARLAVAGRRVLVLEASATIGGGARTAAISDDARYDVCSAVHPFGARSPAFEALGLDRHGLEWLHPPLGLAHPFDDGSAASLHHDLDRTAAEMGRDEGRWRRTVGVLARDWQRTRQLAMGPVPAGVLHHPLQMARFGAMAGLSASLAARAFRGREARALLVGLAAHSGGRLTVPTSAGVGIALAAAAQAAGMPFAGGGSQAIVDALAAVVLANGGTIECGRRVSSLADLPPARALLLDVTPESAAAILGRPAPRWHHGVAAWKLDLVLAGPMPWTAAACHGAGTIHLGGTAAEIVAAEGQTVAGHLPAVPYVIVTQPSVVDPSRAPAGQHVIWAYRHVPNGWEGAAATAGIEGQFDRFAPGWRDLVLHRRVTTAPGFAAYNAGYVGGDVTGGALTPWQTVARPRLAIDPYRIRGGERAWLCSQSTAPGPGVHGMCGWHAAGSVLSNRSSGSVR